MFAEQVLGQADYMAGSPIFPVDLIGKTLLGFFLLMLAIHLTVRFVRRDMPKKKRRKLSTEIGGGIVLVALFLGAAAGAYLLVPQPHVVRTTPKNGQSDSRLDKRIEIVFDRPVSRKILEKSIEPYIPGLWVFEGHIYKTHLARKVVFYPQETLEPDTEYKITLANINNAMRISSPSTYEFSFMTHGKPQISRISPVGPDEKVDIDGKIQLELTEPADGTRFDFEFIPPFSFNSDVDETKKIISVTPVNHLQQAAHYRLTVFQTEVRSDLETNEVVSSEKTEVAFKGEIATKERPGEASVLPNGANVAVDAEVAIRFNEEMGRRSVEENFSIEPNVRGTISWADGYLMVFAPDGYSYDTEYTIKVNKEARKINGGVLGQEVVGHFRTLGEVAVERSFPGHNFAGISTESSIRITMNQEVDKTSATTRFSVSPPIDGSFSWEGRTLVFTPKTALDMNETYRVTLDEGIKGVKGLTSSRVFAMDFTTTQTTTKLAVPAYLQQHSLSCEVSSLRMALAFRGVHVSEEELLGRLGADPTPHRGNVWGNPHQAFVGDVDGRQMTTGYGVYWGPIARIARGYTQAQEFSGWTTEQILNEVLKGNPVIIWGYSGSGRITGWNTPTGEWIHAVGGEHTYVVVGFVGKAENPSRIIVNDSLFGQVYFTKSTFENKWKVFGNSGVIIY